MSPNSSIINFGLEPKSVIDTNILGGTAVKGILAAYEKMMNGGKPSTRIPPKWDGRAAERIWKVF